MTAVYPSYLNLSRDTEHKISGTLLVIFPKNVFSVQGLNLVARGQNNLDFTKEALIIRVKWEKPKPCQ